MLPHRTLFFKLKRENSPNAVIAIVAVGEGDEMTTVGVKVGEHILKSINNKIIFS